MKTVLVLVTAFLFNCVLCTDHESFEYNGGADSSTLYSIIYSDITDILNEFGNNNEAMEKPHNESESYENIEELLSQYHHYLEKARKQRLNYLEKNKPKNKVPNTHHEKFIKMKSTGASKYNDYYKNSFYKQDHNLPQALNPFNMFIPFNSNKYMTTSDQPIYNKAPSAVKNIIFNDELPMSPFTSVPARAPCCKDGLVTLNHEQHQYTYDPTLHSGEEKINIQNTAPLFPEQPNDAITLRIKVGIQLPKFLQDPKQFYDRQSRDKMADPIDLSNEYLAAIKFPPYLNFPMSNLFGNRKNINKNNINDIQNSLHKLSIHKKKKSKVGNSNKKHRKKVITFHNIKIEPELSFAMFNLSNDVKNKTDNHSIVISNLPSNKTFKENVTITISTTTPAENLSTTESQTEENILLLVNITNSIENGTNENNKTENSIETDYTNSISNTTETTFHFIRKREISHEDKSTTPKAKSITSQIKSTVPPKQFTKSTVKNNTPKNKSKNKFTKKNTAGKLSDHKASKSNSTLVKPLNANVYKKPDKNLPSDLELLYWPSTNATKSNDDMKNITAIILEHENKKGKLNMTSETIRQNHTRVLEQAIFGNADWNDVDAVAPAFISFVGKYMEGIMTFCNERICHSMKCTKQNCQHRYCALKDRFKKGHCTGSNYTDSLASMASVMDLPSNVAFEIVDILQDRMIGKLFGKITLCINTKCITFAASKKVFHKYKCINTEKIKELDVKGHCIMANVA